MKQILLTTLLTTMLLANTKTYSAQYDGICIDNYWFDAQVFDWNTMQWYRARVLFDQKLCTVVFDSDGYLVLDLKTEQLTDLSRIHAFDWDRMTAWQIHLTHPFENN